MYICLCNAVSDKTIRRSVQEGSTSIRDLYKELNVGSQCGKCCRAAKSVIDDELLKLAEELSVKVA